MLQPFPLVILALAALPAYMLADEPAAKPRPTVVAVLKIKSALVTLVSTLPDKKAPAAHAVGINVHAKGIIIAPYEVLQDKATIGATLADGTRLAATKLSADPKAGIAILKLESTKRLPAAEFADSNDVEVGETVLALSRGNGDPSFTAAAGTVSAKSRTLTSRGEVIQIDSAISTGLRAGPVVNVQGKLLGFFPRGGAIGYAVPSNHLKKMVEALEQD
jgi:S1-C subfamily serine protease